VAQIISLVATIAMAVLGLVMTLDEPWVKSHKRKLYGSFAIVCLIAILSGIKAILDGNAATEQLNTTLAHMSTSEDKSNKEIIRREKEISALQKELKDAQKELSEKAKLEKQERDTKLASIQARESKRRKEFHIPLAGLIERGKSGMREVASYIAGSVFTEEFRERAVQWHNDGRHFLETTCSPKVAQDFWGPIADPERMEFPWDHLNNNASIAHFYRIRLEVLEKVASNARLCDKS
jgi:hypothetical protein